MKRQAAKEVGISPCRWRTIVKSAAPWPFSINIVDCSIPIPNCHVLGKPISWESELGKITKSDWFDLFTHAGFKKCTPAVRSKKSIYRPYTICIEVYFKQCSWLKNPFLCFWKLWELYLWKQTENANQAIKKLTKNEQNNVSKITI